MLMSEVGHLFHHLDDLLTGYTFDMVVVVLKVDSNLDGYHYERAGTCVTNDNSILGHVDKEYVKGVVYCTSNSGARLEDSGVPADGRPSVVSDQHSTTLGWILRV